MFLRVDFRVELTFELKAVCSVFRVLIFDTGLSGITIDLVSLCSYFYDSSFIF